jgi:putative intracellular protease/amidase
MPTTTPATDAQDASRSPSGRIQVAVVLGASGTVFSDALAPFEVFARSPRFAVAAVAAVAGPAPVQAGPSIEAHHTWADITAGNAPRPDVIVVPAVTDPYGEQEAPLRAWLVQEVDRGAHVLGVCAGARVLAAAGLLEGRAATSHWSRLGALRKRHPNVRWVAGQRYVQDGRITTTAAITSGIPGALRLVADLAGPDEAQRVGDIMSYPGWTLDGPTDIPAASFSLADLPIARHAALSWLRPTFGIALTDGIGEVDVAAAFEAYAVSFTARAVPVAAADSVTTRHGLVLQTVPLPDAPRLDRIVVPGAQHHDHIHPHLRDWAGLAKVPVEPFTGPTGTGGFDGALEYLAGDAGRKTAVSAAKMVDYPTAHLDLAARRSSTRRSLTGAANDARRAQRSNG